MLTGFDADLIYDMANTYTNELNAEKTPPPLYYRKQVANEEMDKLFNQVKDFDRISSNKS